MACNAARSKFFPYLDGELSRAERAALESHLGACPDCQRRIELERIFRARFIDQLRPDPAPERVRRKISQLLATLPAPPQRWWKRRASLSRLTVATVGVALFLMGGILGLALDWVSPATSGSLVRLAEASVDQHRKLVRGVLPYDVEHLNPGAAEQWFRRRLDFKVSLPELPRQNLSFLGGRIGHLTDFDVAALHYQLEGKDVSLFIMPTEEYRKLGLDRSPKFKLVTYQGYDVIVWASHGTAYALVSEIGGRSCLVCHSAQEKLDLPASLKAHGEL